MNIQIISLFIVAMILLQVALLIFGSVGTLCDNLPSNAESKTTVVFKESLPTNNPTGSGVIGVAMNGNNIEYVRFGLVQGFQLLYDYSTSFLIDDDKAYTNLWQVGITESERALAIYSGDAFYIAELNQSGSDQIFIGNAGSTHKALLTVGSTVQGLAATDTNLYFSYTNGTIMKGDINYTTKVLSNIEKFGDTGFTTLTRMAIHENNLFVLDSSPGNIYLYDLSKGLVDPVQTNTGVTGITGMGVSEDYMVLGFVGVVPLSIYDITSSSASGETWKSVCERQENQSQSAYGIMSLVVLIIAIMAIIGLIKYF